MENEKQAAKQGATQRANQADGQARAPSERKHLNLGDEQEVIAMAKAFCVTPQELRDAAATTGTDIAALEEHFQSQ